MVETGVRRDAIEPGPEHGTSLETSPASPGSEKRLLHQVFRFIERAQHAVAVQVELPSIRLGKSRECSFITRSHTGHQGRGLFRGCNADSQKLAGGLRGPIPTQPGLACLKGAVPESQCR